jgi:clan AA aspartic protease (TIGR02281 family)
MNLREPTPRQTRPRRTCGATGWLAVLCIGAGVCADAAAAQVDVAEELTRLASLYGFEVSGEDHVIDALGRAEGDDPYLRLRMLLEGFDHIILQRAGGIERVIIMGEAMPGSAPPKTVVEVDADAAAPADADEIELKTERSGNQHSVRVALESTDGKRIERSLLIDTGADSLVLPKSLIGALSLDEDQLDSRQVQTANGRTQALVGSLPGVWLGGQRVGNVRVSFLDDGQLGSAGLLGMSVLGRYQLTIDDENDTLTLIRR